MQSSRLFKIGTFTSLLVVLLSFSAATALAQTTTPTPTPSGFKAGSTVECPNVGPGLKWRIASKTSQRSDGNIAVCIQIVAGDEAIDLSDTITVNLPQGVTVLQNQPEKGQVTAASASVRWGSFSLNASESTSLLLVISPTDLAKLKTTSIMISGRFARGQGQSFQGLIPGLAPLTEVDVSESGTFKIQMPATGFGYSAGRDDNGLLTWLVGLLSLVGVSLVGRAWLRRRTQV